MRLFIPVLTALLVVSATPATQAASEKSFLIVPGKSFGPITARTTLKDLIRIYGRRHVQVKQLQPPHGDLPKQRGAVINAGTRNEVEVYFREGSDRVQWVIVSRSRSQWRTVQGIRVGTGLAQVQKIFGKPVPVSTFGRDGGGTVQPPRNHSAGRDLILRLNWPEKLGKADGKALSTGRTFMSNHPAARRAGLRVSIIWWDIRG